MNSQESFSKESIEVKEGGVGQMSHLFIFTLAICIPLFGFTQNCQAQGEAGKISGRIRSEAEEVISGAKVTIGNGNFSQSTFTAEDGSYTLSSIAPGTYTLTAEKSGFNAGVRRIIVKAAGELVTADITLVAKGRDDLDSAPAYDDQAPLKPSAAHGAVDPGGYSSGGQAQRSRGMVEGVARLKDNAGAPANSSASHPAALSPHDAALEGELKKALETSPASYLPNHNLGEFYLHAARLGEGIPYIEKAEHIDSSHYENGYDLALAFLEFGDFARAREQLGQMIARQDTAELHDLLGDVEEHAGQYLAAAQEYDRAVRMDPSEENIFDLGTELLLHATFDPAIEVFSSGVNRYPRSAMLQIGLGVALYSRGRYDESIKALCAASDLSPADPRPYVFLGKMYPFTTAGTEEVTTRLARFVKLDPQNPLARFDYAMSVWKGQRAQGGQVNFEQIETLLKSSLALDVKLPDAHFELGNLYSEQKKYPAAVAEYQQALALQPEMVDAHYRLAQAYSRTGDQTRAQHEFELHDRLRKQQLAETERQRAEIKQFVYSVKGEGKQ
ncbi:MAG TPA: tetratricopeptide repeat protein [Terriglobia bacterium]|nr:tetratricopeptide repeat protein [Terriglobia bacterium]